MTESLKSEFMKELQIAYKHVKKKISTLLGIQSKLKQNLL